MAPEARFGEAYEAGRRGRRDGKAMGELPFHMYPEAADRARMVTAWAHQDALLAEHPGDGDPGEDAPVAP